MPAVELSLLLAARFAPLLSFVLMCEGKITFVFDLFVWGFFN